MNLLEHVQAREVIMNRKEVDNFEKIQSQLNGLYKEISNISKKSPNDEINTFKLKYINNVLNLSNNILGEDYKPFNEFNNFKEEELPSNSDVIIILDQYLQCFEKFRVDNIKQGSLGRWYWVIDNEESSLRTSSPVKF